MTIKSQVAAFLILLSSACPAQEIATEQTSKSAIKSELRSELKALTPYLGTWVIDGKLNDGQPFKARSEFTMGMDGNFVIENIFNRNVNGEERQYSHTVWRWDQENEKVLVHRFTHDGTYDELEPSFDTDDTDKPVITTIHARPGSPVAVQQTLKLIAENRISWTVLSSAASENPIMQGVWERKNK